MAKPTILTVDDDFMVSEAITRDLLARYGGDLPRRTDDVRVPRPSTVLTELALRGPPGRPDPRRPADARHDRDRAARAGRGRSRPAPSCCCSPPTPTPTSPSGRSTRSGSTTTCSSRGTHRRSGSTRWSTTCSATGGGAIPTRPTTSASSVTDGRSAATRSRRSWPATTCRTAGSTSSATPRRSG